MMLSFGRLGAFGRRGRALRVGDNVWRIERARRVAALVDAAAYYQAVRSAMRNATQSILIAGWDIDSRARLVGPSGEVDDGLPESLGAFLTALATRRPTLSIRILLWDYSLFYALERELMPGMTLGWNTPPQIELCLDDVLPVGAAHHQKLVVVDDAVAFCGGLDLTTRRWDTPEHDPNEPRRVDLAGLPYPPFHDVQIMVDGAAAAALGELVRDRWSRAACQDALPPQPSKSDPWPSETPPLLRDVAVGIARTLPAYCGDPEVREVEELHLDMIRAARRSIYIENQFLTSLKIAGHLVQRLRDMPELEVVIVVPKTHHSWIEQRTMLAGRIRFRQIIDQAGMSDRVRLLYPQIGSDDGAAEVKVHSKLMIVDDRLLRIGSANLCNRSMGVDTECDLVVEAEDTVARAGIAELRHRLLAEHGGATAAEVAAIHRRTGSLFAVLDAIDGRDRALRPVDDGTLDDAEPVIRVDSVADPERPLGASQYLAAFDTAPSRIGRTSIAIRSALAATLVIGVILIWRYTSLAEFVRPDALTGWLRGMAESPWAPFGVVALFVVGGLVAFPLTVLIACTAAAYGTWPGLPLAATGALSSAFLTYQIGHAVGAEPLRRLLGQRINRVRHNIAARGILAVTAIRLAPVAPFTVVNLAIGAARIPLLDYMLGTAFGLAPGLVIMSALGDRLLPALRDPSGSSLALIVGLLVIWVGLAFALQAVVSRSRHQAPSD